MNPSIEDIEEDIRLCEEYLAADREKLNPEWASHAGHIDQAYLGPERAGRNFIPKFHQCVESSAFDAFHGSETHSNNFVLAGGSTNDSIDAAFDEADVNHDGVLTQSEFREHEQYHHEEEAVLRSPSLPRAELTTEQREEILAKLERERAERKRESGAARADPSESPAAEGIARTPGERDAIINRLLRERSERREARVVGSPGVSHQQSAPLESTPPKKPARQRSHTPRGEKPPRNRPAGTKGEIAIANAQIEGTKQKRASSAGRERSTGEVKEFSFLSRKPKQKYVKSRDDALREHETHTDAECTFKPKITKLPASYNVSDKQVRPEDRIKQLAKPRNALYAKLEKERLAKEAQEMAECTFQPQTGRAPTDPKAVGDLCERLHHEAEGRVAEREKAKREAEEREMRKFSFQPNINEAAVSALVDMSNHKPIHERVAEVQRERREALQRLQLMKEADPELTYKPKVSEASERLAQRRRRREGAGEDITTRLNQEKSKNVERKAKLHHAHEVEERSELTFEPKIGQNTEKILGDNPMFKVGFLERQEAYAKASKAKKREAQIAELEDLPFNPDIGNANEILSQKEDTRVKESFLERVERLSNKDAERKRNRNKEAHEAYYSQFTFQPEIDGHSRKLGKAATSEELYKNERGQAVKARLKAGAERAFEQEHTFQPAVGSGAKFDPAKLNKYRLNLDDPEGLTERIEEQRREKEGKAEEQRRLQEYNELKECTFQPNVSISQKHVPEPSGPVIVRGLGRHLELKEMAKKQEEERLLREEEVFKTQPRQPAAGYTVPQPFKLSENVKGKERAERARQQLLAERKKECTFHPKTNLVSNRDLVRQIMTGEEQNPDL